MTVTAKVTSISLYNYYTEPSGNIQISCSDGTSMTIPLDKEMAGKLMAIALAEFEKRQTSMSAAISAIQPTALIPYDAAKTIDDEIPF